MSKRSFFGVCGVVALLVAVALFMAVQSPSVEAAPAAQTTPVAVYPAAAPSVIQFLRTTILTTTTSSRAQNVIANQKVDLQTVIQPQSTPNALSVQLQFSNDGVNWVGGPYIIATPNATPQNLLGQYAVYGQYARVQVVGANANPVTVNVTGVGK